MERFLKSQAMGFIRDKEDEAMYAILVCHIGGPVEGGADYKC